MNNTVGSKCVDTKKHGESDEHEWDSVGKEEQEEIILVDVIAWRHGDGCGGGIWCDRVLERS